MLLPVFLWFKIGQNIKLPEFMLCVLDPALTFLDYLDVTGEHNFALYHGLLFPGSCLERGCLQCSVQSLNWSKPLKKVKNNQTPCVLVRGPDGVKLENANSSIATVTGLQVGTYEFTLTVKDERNLQSQSSVNVIVKEGTSSHEQSCSVTAYLWAVQQNLCSETQYK